MVIELWLTVRARVSVWCGVGLLRTELMLWSGLRIGVYVMIRAYG